MKLINDFINQRIESKGGRIIYYDNDDPIIVTIKNIRRSIETCTNINELYCLAGCVQQLCTKYSGALVEIGVYKGGSAALIATYRREQRLYLYDTFSGLPPKGAMDAANPNLHEGNYRGTLKEVKKNLSSHDNIQYIPGKIEDNLHKLPQNILLAHIDTDLYDSVTLSAHAIIPRLHKHGIIFFSDYPQNKGVKKAVDRMKDQLLIIPYSNSNAIGIPYQRGR